MIDLYTHSAKCTKNQFKRYFSAKWTKKTPTECDTFVTRQLSVTLLKRYNVFRAYCVCHFCSATVYPAPTEWDTFITH